MNNKKYRLEYDTRAREIVAQMTLEEKVYLMSGQTSVSEMRKSMLAQGEHYNWIPYPAGGNERLGVPKLLFCDGPRGVVCSEGKSTCFPVSMARGATFDPDLEERIGMAIGREVRAYGGNYFGGVCINIPYHPGWGRSQETYGEDPCHVGRMGAALARGVQSQNVIACVKHYAFNSMELSRFKVSVECTKRTEREVFLPHFKDVIDAGAASVMTSYNFYQGIKCGHHNYLINQVLKGEWGFDGFVISDFNHGVKATEEAANGGMDVEMAHTMYFGDRLVEAVRAGRVSEEVINEAALRIVRTLLAFTEAEDPQTYDESVLSCPEHIALALEAARKSITLLKNEGGMLPLDATAVTKIAVLGELADDMNIGDHGSSQVYPPYVVNILEGIKKQAGKIEVVYESGEDLSKARKAAADADIVIVVAGCRHFDEGEYISFRAEEAYAENGGDRFSLRLRDNEVELIRAAGAENPNLAVVLIGGNAILIDEWEPVAKAILFAYYPGMEGGTALAEILFGVINPSGKLPFVIPYSESDLPEIDWNAEKQYYDYYHGYWKLDRENKTPLYPFGYGLSYTQYRYSSLQVTCDGETLTATCDITNTGSMAGEEVVQMYVAFPGSQVERPVKMLRGFTRVAVAPGETRRAVIQCPVEKLKWYNPETGTWEPEHIDYTVLVGPDSHTDRLIAQTIHI